MQVSYEWLSEFVDLKGINASDIAHRLTMSGLEIEETEIIKPRFSNIITAKILEINPHPDAEKLRLATIDTGAERKTVVCGAQNIEAGQIIPYASVGSKVFSRKTGELFELTPAVIRGVVSEGMLCSQDELGLEGLQDEDGILILNRLYKDIPLGENLEAIMNLSEEIIFHLSPTANRGDEMSVLGVAREICALYDHELNFSRLEYVNTPKECDFKVEIIDKETCKYYSIGVLKDLKLAPSPAWMQRRLNACGMRPINNVVDITNYVLLEYGTPLHAFDFDKLNNYLCVRYAKEGEMLTTIDEVERKLTSQTVLIATEEHGVCLAGVFGGNNSEIDDNTKNIALEAAYFTPNTNRKSARSVGYRSEASARFERGIDIEMVKQGLLRAVDLLIKYADAKFEGMVETGESKFEPVEITLRSSEVGRILGIEISLSRCIEILQNLGFELLGSNDIAAKFKAPSFRAGDVTREIDLIEEVARIHGYDKIAPQMPLISESAEISEESKVIKHLNELFSGCGFDEIVTSSLVGESVYKEFMTKFDPEKSIKILNPQSEEHSMLRQSLAPSLLSVVKHNFDNGNKNFWLYEMGRVYSIDAPATNENSGVLEQRRVSGAIFGNIDSEILHKRNAPDFFTLKGVMESLFEELGLTKRIIYSANVGEWEFLHPAQSAKIELLGKNSITLGFAGKIHPILKDKMKFNQDLFIFELNLEAILEAMSPGVVKYKKLSSYGSVQRDMAFVLPQNVSYDEVLKVIKKAASKNIYKNAQVFDIYHGANIEEGKKSMAIRITLQDEENTLKDEIINQEIAKIKTALEKSIPELLLR